MRELDRVGVALVLTTVASVLRPAPAMSVAEWSDRYRQVPAESGSPYPGRWRNDRVPYLVEPQNCCGMDDPARVVVLLASAQSAKSEAALNAIGHTIHTRPAPILVMLPSLDEAAKYNRIKLGVTIDATPELRERVGETVSRDENGSTTMFKPFRGGFLQIVNAGSSKALQMISACLRVYEEPTGYPLDVGGRGDPIDQADARSKAWKARGEKKVYVGTPGLAGACRITAAYEKSDQRRYYVPCPHCGCYQVLRWQRLRHSSEQAPHGAYFECAAYGCVIEIGDRPAMLERGRWIKTYEARDQDADPAPADWFPAEELERWLARTGDGRQPGFAWWQAYSPFVSWDDTVAEQLDAVGKPTKLKVLYQQAYGEAWEETGEAPDSERLLERRQAWQAKRLPAGVLFLSGAVDVQGDRLEWAVYGWGQHLDGFHIDRGVIAGDPTTAEPWLQLDQVVARTYRDAWGRPWPVDVWGVDAGYLSQHVYRYALRHAAEGRVRALDGRPGWRLPSIGTPKTVDVDWQGRKMGAVQLWPVGTWDLKSELYGKLRLTIAGPRDDIWPRGCMWFNDQCDATYFEQLTAEFLADVVTSKGYTQKEWVKNSSRRNEQHDLAVYALGLAHHLSDGLDPDDWQALAADRLGPAEAAQLDLAALWAPGLARQVDAAGALLPPVELALKPPLPLTPAQAAAPASASASASINPFTGRPRGSWHG